MESKQNIDLVNVAVQRLVEEKGKHHNPDGIDNIFVESDDEQLLLSRLLSEIESLKQEGRIKGRDKDKAIPNANPGEPKSGIENDDSKEKASGSREVTTADEIAKELRHVRRQNTITHCLLSIMIVLTVGWQLSEVSLILKVKDGISHPFRSFGSMITGMFKPKLPAMTDRDGDSNGETTMMSNFSQMEPPQTQNHPFKMPELPHFEIPDIGVNGKDD